jgi:hypothetical protein
MTVDGTSMATVRELDSGREALQSFVEKRIAHRTRQAAARAPAASDEDEQDPPKFKRRKGKHEGKKSGRSEVVVAETTRCRDIRRRHRGCDASWRCAEEE